MNEFYDIYSITIDNPMYLDEKERIRFLLETLQISFIIKN